MTSKRVRDMTDDEVRGLPGGPYPDYAIQDTAERAAEAIRLLNYLTLEQDGAPGLHWPADVYDAVASLKIGALREYQALGQLARWLVAEYEAGRVAHDSGQDAGRWVTEVLDCLGSAQVADESRERALNGAHNALSGLRAAGE